LTCKRQSSPPPGAARRTACHAARARRQRLAGADQSRKLGRGPDRRPLNLLNLIIQVQGPLGLVHSLRPAASLISNVSPKAHAMIAPQVRDLTAAGCERTFQEKVSSVAKRDQLDACLGFLREGDALVVTKPDRLARSTAELLTIEADLSKRGVGLVVLSTGGERLDTRNPTSKLMLTILAGVATWERDIMLERQREGIAKAKDAGVYKGRPATIDAAKVKALHAPGKKPAHIAKELKMARSSVYRLLGA
jgi:DNA invertase Pin-like site-specific DNA recombinase